MADHMIIAFLAAMGIPTAITAFCSWGTPTAHYAPGEKAEELERSREKAGCDVAAVHHGGHCPGGGYSQGGAADPGCALQRGYATGLLEYAADIKHRQKDFLTSLGVHALHDD